MKKIDISGPDGNSFVILGLAKQLAEQLDYNSNKIIEEMTEGNYNDLLQVFNNYFSVVVKLVSPHKIDSISDELYVIEVNDYI